jgi:hypothetical protein
MAPPNPHRPRDLSADTGRDCPPCDLKSGALDLIERLLATDIANVRGDPKLKLLTRVSLGYTGLTINLANTKCRRARRSPGSSAHIARL